MDGSSVSGNPWVLYSTGAGLGAFFTHDSNPTHAESGLGAGFIFYPWVHPKSEKNKIRKK
jgi:hypothetical protein